MFQRNPLKWLVDVERLSEDRGACAVLLPILKEVDRRIKHPFFAYKPDDHVRRNQLAFHQSAAPCRLVFGGNQSGKTRAIAQEIAWWLCENHPHRKTAKAPKIFCISATYRTIQEGVWRHLKTILPEWLIEIEGPMVPGWQIPTYVKMKTGAEINFISGEGREDARRKIQAAAIDLAVVDEEIDGILHVELITRRLAYGGEEIVGATLVRSEPWCLELEDRAEAGDPYVFLTRLSTYIAAERGHVDSRVIKELEAHLSEEERLVRLEGKSRRSEGLVYPEFDGHKHVIEPFAIPSNWTRYCAIDPGWRTCGVLWAAAAPDGHYVIYRELYYHGADYHEIANAIYSSEGWLWNEEGRSWVPTADKESIQVRWIDPTAFGHHESGQRRIGHLLADPPYNLICCPAQNDTYAGIELCRRALMPGLSGTPKMRVFKNCVNFVKEIRSYRWEKDDRGESRREAPDRPIKRKDHLLDCWRYMELMGVIWCPPPDPILFPTSEDEMPRINASPVMQRIVEDHWNDILRKQRGEGSSISHPSGLGSEY